MRGQGDKSLQEEQPGADSPRNENSRGHDSLAAHIRTLRSQPRLQIVNNPQALQKGAWRLRHFGDYFRGGYVQ